MAALNNDAAYEMTSPIQTIHLNEAVLNVHNCGKLPDLQYKHPSLFYRAVIRTFDIFASFFSLLFIWPFMLIIALIVKIDSKGPAFYRQERLGINGKPFTLYKFRSMILDAEKDGIKWANSDDDRITRVGKALRKFRLDELPQLVNILTGSMSIVGPRPERSAFYDEFEKLMPGFKQRLLIKPGLTGWAQVNGGYDLTADEKIVFDLYYIENQSFKLEIKCIIKTISVIFKGEGAY